MVNDTIIPGFDSDRDDSLRIDLKKIAGVDGGLSLSLTGYIDTYNSNSFQKRVQKAIEHGYKRLIFNCGGLNYVSSTGIGSFTAFLKSLKGIGGDIVLLDVQPKVYEVFQLLGFSQFFNIRDNQDDAENYFRGSNQVETNMAFPHNFNCPICSKRLKAVKAGRFRCSECKTILAVDETGNVFLG
ncbi:MAG: STAS domain-containing protein [Spirochaetaceae bacterium]|jgi:anti-anti-sigma factor|nr:STAS domain-containing protein [Spirochaetaceae bacterium]